MNKGNILVILLSIIALVSVIAAIYFFSQNQQKNIIEPTITPTPVVDDTKNWKTYTNEKYGFEFKYPSKYDVTEVDSSGLSVLLFFTAADNKKNYLNLQVEKFPKNEDLDLYLDHKPVEKTKVNGNELRIFDFPNGYCDGPGCSQPFTVAVLFNNSDRFSLKWFDEGSLNEFNQILGTFRFLEDNQNLINFDSLEVGSKIGQMTVVSIKPGISTRPISDTNFLVTFRGQVTITGEYFQLGPSAMFANRIGVCFDKLDSKSLALIPQKKGEKDWLWFCFKNSSVADKEFSTGSGSATVIIDNYESISVPSEVWNKATLVKVLKKS